MDSVLLARIQFAVSAGFHFLFPPTTFGLILIIFILESLYLKYNSDIYKNFSTFLIKILGLCFAVGVATGIVLEFAFGTNWAEYSKLVGDIFGAPLAAEGIFAFFLESVFMAILLFGRKRVSKKVFWLSTLLVFFASHLSGLWIIIANSWMQTPAGFQIVDGKAVLTNFFEAAINHTTTIRFLHVVVAGWTTGAFLVAGICAYYFLKKKHTDYAKLGLDLSVIILVFTSLFQLFLGHTHSVKVARYQPEKMAAFEGLWETKTGADLSLFGIPDEKMEKTKFSIGVPKFLSFLIYGRFDAEVKGLKDFPKDERPPVFLVFETYHIMIGLGMFFIALSLFALFLLLKNKLYDTKWFLFILVLCIPLPHVANEAGWIAAEVGRQPWAVYKVLKTVDSVSIVVPAWQILLSLIIFILIYILLFIIFIKILLKFVKNGPNPIEIKKN